MSHEQKPDVLDPTGGKGLWPDREFEQAFANTVVLLNHMLGTRYQTIRAGPVTEVLAIEIAKIVGYHERQQRFARDWEAARLGFLVMDIGILYKHRRPLFQRYRQRLRTVTENEFPGLRFEIAMAINLMIAGLPFECPEPPDFRLATSCGVVDIECTSTTVSRLRDRSLVYKIEAAIKEKARKPYATRDTILFLDYTNVLFTALASGVETTHSQARACGRQQVEGSAFGAIVLFAAVQNIPMRRYEHLFDQFVHSQAPEAVKLVVDKLVSPREPMRVEGGIPKGM